MNVGQQFNGEFFKPMAGIYKITNTKNGRVYVGQSRGVLQRIAHHFSELQNKKHSSSDLQNDWDSYGPGAFVVEVVECVFNDEFRLERERALIKRYLLEDVDIYNVAVATKYRDRLWIDKISQEYLDEARDNQDFYQYYLDNYYARLQSDEAKEKNHQYLLEHFEDIKVRLRQYDPNSR